MQLIFDIVILLLLLAVVAVLGLGVYSMYRGGDFAAKYGNRFMRLRVILQAVAVVVILAALVLFGRPGPT